jgi:hypothetical protein
MGGVAIDGSSVLRDSCHHLDDIDGESEETPVKKQVRLCLFFMTLSLLSLTFTPPSFSLGRHIQLQI